MPSSVASTESGSTLLRTYRYVRLGMVVMVALLLVAIGLDYLATGTLLDSISAYYYSDVHSVLVGSLCAAGACLVIYRGIDDLSDALLNISGFLAFIVAFVPTNWCEREASPYCPVSQEMALANVRALLITTALVLLVGYVISVRGWWPTMNQRAVSGGVKRLYWVTVLAFVALVGWVWFGQESFLKAGHLTAAGVLFVCMIVVVGIHGRVLEQRNVDGEHDRLRAFYRSSFIVTLLGSAVLFAFVMWPKFTGGSPSPLPQPGFWLELWVLGAFGVFWLTQTFTEVWDTPASSPSSTRDGTGLG